MRYKKLLMIAVVSSMVCCLSACGKTVQPDNESSNMVVSTAELTSADTTEMLPSRTTDSTETTKATEPAQTDLVPTEEQSTEEAQSLEPTPSITEAESEPASSVSEIVPETSSVNPAPESQSEPNSDGEMPEIEIPAATDDGTQEESRASAAESAEVQTSSADNEPSPTSETETSEEDQGTISTNEDGDIVLPEL